MVAISKRADVVAFLVVAAGCLFLLLWLLAYHVFLILRASTTNEHLKGAYAQKPNPHHRGACTNLWTFLTEPCPPSRVADLRAAVGAVRGAAGEWDVSGDG